MRRALFRLALLVGTALVPLVGAAEPPPEFAVIVHPDCPAKTIDRAELAAIFTATRREWSDGTNTIPLNAPAGDPAREVFDRVVLGLEPSDVTRFWIDQRIRGQGLPPRQVPDPKLILKVVARLRGSIGYVPVDLIGPSVRVVARIRDGRVIGPSS